MNIQQVSRRTVLVLAIASAIALTGCNKQQGAQKAAAARPVDVTVQVMASHPVQMNEEISGRTVAYRIAEVRPQVSGVLQRRLFTEGQYVKAGQPLYQIDASTYKASEQNARASLAQAEAELALARADAARSSALVKANAVSKQSDDSAQARLKTAEAAVQAAQANLSTARINLRYTSVLAPISGKVSISEVTPGALMNAYQAQRMTVIHQLDPIYVDVQRTNTQLLKLREDIASGKIKALPGGSAPVKIKLEDGTDYPLTGKLTFEGVSVGESSGTVTLRAVFPNPKGTLLPGMFVRATLPSGNIPQAITVSQRSVMRDMRGDPYVYVVTSDNKIEQRSIKIGGAVGSEWVVESGLQVGDKVVYSGLDKVAPGVVVNPAEEGGSASSAEASTAASTAAGSPAASAVAK